MRAVIHIGTEKTGSSTIQRFLDVARDSLRERGFYVPMSPGRVNHRWIPSVCMDPHREDDFAPLRSLAADSEDRARKIRSFKESFDSEVQSLESTAHTFLISSEHFHSRLPTLREVSRVKEFLADRFDEFLVLCYLRPQGELCASRLSTALRVGHDIGLEDFVAQCVPDNPYYNYSALLERWAAVFGDNAIEFRLFGRNHLRQGRLLDDFSEAIGTQDLADLAEGLPSKNQSLRPEGQMIARSVNRALGGIEGARTSPAFHSSIIHLIESRLTGRGSGLSPEDSMRIFHAFEASNEKLRMRIFPNQNQIFEPQESAVGNGCVPDELVVDVIAEVMTRFANLR